MSAFSLCKPLQPDPIPPEETVDLFDPGDMQLTWYDDVADSLVTCDGFNDFTVASQVIPQARSASSPRNVPQYNNIKIDPDKRVLLTLNKID